MVPHPSTRMTAGRSTIERVTRCGSRSRGVIATGDSRCDWPRGRACGRRRAAPSASASPARRMFGTSCSRENPWRCGCESSARVGRVGHDAAGRATGRRADDLSNKAFQIHYDESGIRSLNRTGDVHDTDYILENGRLGRLLVRYRTATNGDWRELRELVMTGQLPGRSVSYTLGARLPTLTSQSTAAAATGAEAGEAAGRLRKAPIARRKAIAWCFIPETGGADGLTEGAELLGARRLHHPHRDGRRSPRPACRSRPCRASTRCSPSVDATTRPATSSSRSSTAVSVSPS